MVLKSDLWPAVDQTLPFCVFLFHQIQYRNGRQIALVFGSLNDNTSVRLAIYRMCFATEMFG